jgi:hypothetical protein
MNYLILLACCSGLSAVETSVYRVVFHPGGLVINVQSPDEDEVDSVALRWITLPKTGAAEAEAAASKSLRDFLPPGTLVRLWAPEKDIPRDQKGRLQAVVVRDSDHRSAEEEGIARGFATFAPDASVTDEWRQRLAPPAKEAAKP